MARPEDGERDHIRRPLYHTLSCRLSSLEELHYSLMLIPGGQ